MKEEQKKKTLPENEQGKQVKKIKEINPAEQQEQKSLLFEADRISPVNKKIDKVEIETIGGHRVAWAELVEAHTKYNSYISEKVRDWQPTFPEELYRQWRRLNNWDMNSKSRPKIFAAYTVRDIYGSLPKEIYTTLDLLNEYIDINAGIRMYRYCQLLTKECHDEVRDIIGTAVRLATSSKDIYEYRLKLAAIYGRPFTKTVQQLDAFRNNDDILNTI